MTNRTEYRLLLLASPEGEAGVTARFLAEHEIATTFCPDFASLQTELAHGAGALLMTEASLPAEALSRLTAELSRQPEWSDIPVIILTHAGFDAPTVNQAMRDLGNVLVVEASMSLAPLLSAVRTALRTRRHQYQIRDLLADHAQSEAALRGSEDRFRSLFENAAVGMAYLQMDGRFTRVNHTLSQLLGYSAQELLTKTIADVMQPDDRASALQALERLRTGLVSDVSSDQRCLCKDGKPLWVELTCSLLGAADGTPQDFIVVIEDITWRKTAEDAMRESEARLFRALDGSHDGFWDWDVQSGQIQVTKRWCQILRIEAAEAPETIDQLSDWIHQDDLREVLQTIRAVFDQPGDGRFQFEHRFVRRDGSVIWVSARGRVIQRDAAGRVLRVTGAISDVTEHKLAQEAVRTMALFPEENPFPVLRVAANGTLLFANRGASDVLQEWKCAVGDRVPEAVRRAVSDALEHGRHGEMECTCSGRNYSVVLAPIRERGYVNLYGRDMTDRHRAEAALRERENRLALATAVAGLGVFEWHPPSQAVRWENERMFEIFGRTRDQGPFNLATWKTDVLHPEDRALFERAWADAIAGQRLAPLACRIRHADGAVRWIELIGHLELDAAGAPARLVGVVADITEKRAAEDALRRARDQLARSLAQTQAIIDSLTEGLIIADGRANLLYHNPASLVLHAFTSLDEACRPLSDLPAGWSVLDLQGQPVPVEQWPMNRALRGERFTQYELRVRRNDTGHQFVGSHGGTPVFDAQGRLICAIVTIRDVTRQKEAAEALWQTKGQLEAILNHTHLLVACLDREFNFILVNQAYAHAEGKEPEFFIGRNHFALYQNAENQAIFRSVVETGRPFFAYAKPFRYPHAPERGLTYWDWSLIPVKDERQEVSQLVLTLVNVTERRQAEEQLRQLNETLETLVTERTAVAEQRTEQLRALIGELTQAEQRERQRSALVLHDHVQPLLVAARMRLGMVLSDPSEAKRHLRAREVEELITQGIEAARSLSVELHPPVLQDQGLGAALEWLRKWMKSKHELTVNLRIDPKAEPADQVVRLLCFQTVRELLLNVVKHAKVHRARVSLQRRPSGAIELVVADRGVGFDVQARRKPNRLGRGFGLWSIEQRIGMMGGRISMKSQRGKGTTTTIVTPFSTSPEGAASDARNRGAGGRAASLALARAAAAVLPQRIRIVLADDHRILRESLSKILRLQPDFDVVGEAADGLQALEMARELRPDVLVLDVSMPRLDGLKATQMLKREWPDLRVIGLSMHERDQKADAMCAAGAAAYLVKTGPIDELVQTIRNCATVSKSNQRPRKGAKEKKPPTAPNG